MEPEQAETGEPVVSNWFAARIIMYVQFKQGQQTAFPVWENIVLVQADSEEAAFRKAEKAGRDAEGDDGGTFRWSGKPAKWAFGGVRKLTLCQNADERPGDGTEISYIQMRVRSKAALEKLIQSERVGVELREEFGADEDIPADESPPASGARIGRTTSS